MLRSIPLGIIGVLSFTFTPDCAEYGQYTTGTEAKGITFAIQTFAVKLAAAISGSMGLALLGWFGFKTEFEVNGVIQEVSSFADLEAINAIAQQTSEALDGLWFTYNIVPIIGLVIALIIWAFYKLNDKDVQIMADYNVGKITRDEAEKLLSRKYGAPVDATYSATSDKQKVKEIRMLIVMKNNGRITQEEYKDRINRLFQ